MNLDLTKMPTGVSLQKENAEFVARMEDILDIYEMPYNPDVPVLCVDEKPY